MATVFSDIRLVEDNWSAELTIPQRVGRPIVRNLRTDDLEQLIRQLVFVRSQMLPSIPENPSGEGPRLETQRIPIAIDGTTGHPALLIEHPGMGWLTVVLDPSIAIALAENLKQVAIQSARGQGSAN
jgi:hypothetical protein